jgi:RNA polymerase primary sigma factor
MRNLQITASITNRESAVTEIYFNEIGKTGLITADEEVMLAQKIKMGDLTALDKLVKANLRFVVSVAKKYEHRGMPLGDLINEGNLGLIKAARRFDETRGFKFISFAVWWIRESIISAIAEHDRTVRLPMNVINVVTKISQSMAALEGQLERMPTNDELAEFAGTNLAKVSDAQKYYQRAISLDNPISEGDEYTLIDKLPGDGDPTDCLVTMMDSKMGIASVLNLLAAKERLVIEYSFGLIDGREYSNGEIADIIGYSVEMVRNYRKTAINKLKAGLKNSGYKEALREAV